MKITFEESYLLLGLVGSLYVLWSYIQYAVPIFVQGERFVYSVLDWSNPGPTAILCALLLLVACPLLCLLFTGLSRLKESARREKASSYDISDCLDIRIECVDTKQVKSSSCVLSITETQKSPIVNGGDATEQSSQKEEEDEGKHNIFIKS